MLYNPQLDTFICNVETFNRCENNNEVLVAFKSWESVHPLIRIIPVDWDYTMPFGILHSKTPSDKVKRLIKAIYELDKKYKPLQGAYNTVDSDIVPEEIKKSQKKEKNYDIEPGHLPQAEVIYSPAQVISMKDAGADGFQVVPLTQSEGYISAEYAYLYPPGIPMLVPGERITAQIREHFQWYTERTYEIQGVEKEGYIEVWTHG